MSEANINEARAVFDTICRTMDNIKISCEKDEEKLSVFGTIGGEDIPVRFIMKANPNNSTISFFSFLPFKTDASKRVDMAMAVSVANFGLANGSFDYNIKDGTIIFRIGVPMLGLEITEKFITHMFILGVKTTDKYNEKFLQISLGSLDFQTFLESEG